MSRGWSYPVNSRDLAELDALDGKPLPTIEEKCAANEAMLKAWREENARREAMDYPAGVSVTV